MVHRQLAHTAKGLAEEHYETLASDNDFYKRWPKMKAYVGHHWRLYVPMARSIFTHMLGQPNVEDHLKRQMYEALMLDGAVNPKHMATPEKAPVFKII